MVYESKVTEALCVSEVLGVWNNFMLCNFQATYIVTCIILGTYRLETCVLMAFVSLDKNAA